MAGLKWLNCHHHHHVIIINITIIIIISIFNNITIIIITLARSPPGARPSCRSVVQSAGKISRNKDFI